MVEIIAIIVLGLVCVGQAVERYFYAKDMSQKLNDSIKAVMSRNINEYIAAVSSEQKPQRPYSEPDEVLLDTVSDDLFDRYIENQTK